MLTRVMNNTPLAFTPFPDAEARMPGIVEGVSMASLPQACEAIGNRTPDTGHLNPCLRLSLSLSLSLGLGFGLGFGLSLIQ